MKYIIILLLFAACNPVKQVLKDRNKFEQVAKEVVKAGYCVNDTVVKSVSDTLITYDTAFLYGETIRYDTDTIYQPLYEQGKLKIRDRLITKTVTIRDTIKSFIRDTKLETIYKAERDDIAVKFNNEKEAKEAAQKRASKWFWYFIIACAAGVGSHFIRSKFF